MLHIVIPAYNEERRLPRTLRTLRRFVASRRSVLGPVEVLVVDNGSYGTIRMHQERDYPERLSATTLHNPDFAALARAFGAWSATVERTEEFAPALDDALGRSGLRLLHLKTDVEVITNGTTISALRERSRG